MPSKFPNIIGKGNAWGDKQLVPKVELIIIEGAGSLHPILRPILDASIWIDCDSKRGLKRALQRDGKKYASELQRFRLDQEKFLAKTKPQPFATYIVPVGE